MATETDILTNYEYLRTYLNNILNGNVTYIEWRNINGVKAIYFTSETHGICNRGMVTFEGYDVYATLFKGDSISDVIEHKYIETKIFNAIKPYKMTDINSEIKVLGVIKSEYDLLVQSGRTFGEYFLAIRDCYKMAKENMRNNSISNPYYSSKIDRTVGYVVNDVLSVCDSDVDVKYSSVVLFYKGIDCTLSFSTVLN